MTRGNHSGPVQASPTRARANWAAAALAGACLLNPLQSLAGAHEGGQAAEGFQIGDLALNIYGFVMADTIYDFKRVDPDWNDTLRVSTIATRGEPFGGDGEVVFGVRQSRIGFDSNFKTDNGDVRALFEWELFGTGGDAGQTTPRLRHAWVEWKDFGAGQYWSNFMDISVFPNTIDYWGPTGMIFYRNKQLRYTFPFESSELAFSLEDPDTALSVGRFRDESVCEIPGAPVGNCDSTIGDVVQKDNDVPDLTARYRDETNWGHWQIAGMLRKLGYERTDNGKSDYETGWGFNGSTVINTFGRDQLKLQVAWGEGIGNYFNDGGLDLAPSDADLATTDAEAVEILGIVAYYDHYWNDKWSTSIGWSMTDLDTEDGQADTEFEKGQIASLNLLHYPTEHVMLGLEGSWGQREDVDGEDGDDYRVQFSIKVDWALADLMKKKP
jgi:hypothetical protein